MKDRDMHNVKLYFKLINNRYYYLKSIEQPEEKITETYIANLAGTTAKREWCDKSMGSWITYVPLLKEHQFNTLVTNVERLGGTVILMSPAKVTTKGGDELEITLGDIEIKDLNKKEEE